MHRSTDRTALHDRGVDKGKPGVPQREGSRSEVSYPCARSLDDLLGHSTYLRLLLLVGRDSHHAPSFAKTLHSRVHRIFKSVYTGFEGTTLVFDQPPETPPAAIPATEERGCNSIELASPSDDRSSRGDRGQRDDHLADDRSICRLSGDSRKPSVDSGGHVHGAHMLDRSIERAHPDQIEAETMPSGRDGVTSLRKIRIGLLRTRAEQDTQVESPAWVPEHRLREAFPGGSHQSLPREGAQTKL